MGATEEELRETMAIAMTVGATRIQILQEKVLASLPGNESRSPSEEMMEAENPSEQPAVCTA